MPARFLFLIFTICLFFSFGISSSLAQNSPDTYANSTVDNISKSTDNLLIGIAHTFSCLTEGKSLVGTPCFTGLENNSAIPSLQENGYLPAKEVPSLGAVGLSQALILGLFINPPIRSADYLASFGEQFGLTKPAYAQISGSGNVVISPILNLWQLMRNIAYLALIIIFVVVGFMIMFKSKINPQTVIGVQNAIPGLIIGLILITFSYFLSALLIDMTFVGAGVAGQIMESTKPPIIGAGKTQEVLKNDNILSIFNSYIGYQGAQTVVNSSVQTLDFLSTGFISALVDRLLNLIGCQYGGETGQRAAKFVAGHIVMGNSVQGMAEAAGWTAGCVSGGLALQSQRNTIIATVFYLILIIALIVAMFKLLFSLISCYISIIVMTITAPFYFLIGSIPGRSNTISGWFSSMLANILVFPVVFLAFMFAAYLVPEATNKFGTVSGSAVFTGSSLPLLGGFPSDFIRIILAYGVLLISPGIPEMVKGALKIKGDNFGKAGVGNFVGGATLGTTVGASGYNRFWKGNKEGSLGDPRGPLGKLARRIPGVRFGP